MKALEMAQRLLYEQTFSLADNTRKHWRPFLNRNFGGRVQEEFLFSDAADLSLRSI